MSIRKGFYKKAVFSVGYSETSIGCAKAYQRVRQTNAGLTHSDASCSVHWTYRVSCQVLRPGPSVMVSLDRDLAVFCVSLSSGVGWRVVTAQPSITSSRSKVNWAHIAGRPRDLSVFGCLRGPGTALRWDLLKPDNLRRVVYTSVTLLLTLYLTFSSKPQLRTLWERCTWLCLDSPGGLRIPVHRQFATVLGTSEIIPFTYLFMADT